MPIGYSLLLDPRPRSVSFPWASPASEVVDLNTNTASDAIQSVSNDQETEEGIPFSATTPANQAYAYLDRKEQENDCIDFKPAAVGKRSNVDMKKSCLSARAANVATTSYAAGLDTEVILNATADTLEDERGDDIMNLKQTAMATARAFKGEGGDDSMDLKPAAIPKTTYVGKNASIQGARVVATVTDSKHPHGDYRFLGEQPKSVPAVAVMPGVLAMIAIPSILPKTPLPACDILPNSVPQLRIVNVKVRPFSFLSCHSMQRWHSRVNFY